MATDVAIFIPVLLGLKAASGLVVMTRIQAMELGYDAPDVLVRAFGAAAKATTAKTGAVTVAGRGLVERWVALWNR